MKIIVKNLGGEPAYVQGVTDGNVGDQRKLDSKEGLEIEGDMIVVEDHVHPPAETETTETETETAVTETAQDAQAAGGNQEGAEY